MFTDSYLPTKDGVVTSILLTKGQLEKMGHEITVFAPEPYNGQGREEGVQYFRAVSYRDYPGYSIPMFPSNKCEILRDLDIDIIHTHGVFFMGVRSMFAARTLHMPVVVSFHTMVTDAVKYYARLPVPDWVITHLLWVYLRQLLERADAVVAPSTSIRDELLEKAPDIRRIDVIPTGVDCSRFCPTNSGAKVRAKYGLNGERIVLHVGRIAREKNLELVMNGFAKLSAEEKDVRLMIVGDGPAKEHYMGLAKDIGIADRTIFTGFVPDEDLPSYYAACDTFVIASKFETQGLVALEAMASGKPVAGIDYRAISEIIDNDKNGFLFDESATDCADAISCALASPIEIRNAARSKAETYSVSESVEKLVELYDFAMSEKNGRVNGH